MRTRVWFTVWMVLAAGMGTTVRAEDDFFLKDGEKVVFFGDSITQGGHYVTYVEAFLMTRFPEQSFSVINHGISSETVSGTSEADHSPKRPNALDRFERDVLNYKPDVLVACFGMNDGVYAPLDSQRFALYQKGIRTLVDGVREQGGRVTLLTPPPFDPYRRKASDPDANVFGYKYPYLGYDDVLNEYGRWERSLRSENVTVADVHSLMRSHLDKRRKAKVSYYLSGDAVHPNETGHWL
ncbi:MAG TPA: SGNH/GDSL hydrolase family protein, partial [Isosphaeraceae bacterium]|nr:SGNH/GDSL hydrolase family protein [Isosphaeraceae bacterium]